MQTFSILWWLSVKWKSGRSPLASIAQTLRRAEFSGRKQRWFSLSVREVRGNMAERNVALDHTTVWRLVQT